MRYIKMKHAIGVVILLAVAGGALAYNPAAQAGDNKYATDLPSPLCDRLQVPEGNEVNFHVYARGVQIYRWNGTSWAFWALMATMFCRRQL